MEHWRKKRPTDTPWNVEWPYEFLMFRNREERGRVVVVEAELSVVREKTEARCTGCKTDHGEKRAGHGEVTHYKSRVFPFCLALFVYITFYIWKYSESHGIFTKDPLGAVGPTPER